MKKYLVSFLAIGLLFVSCTNDDDTEVDTDNTENPIDDVAVRADFPVQNFMWQTMNAFYFWQASVPVLADDNFSTEEDYVQYLSENNNPSDFFFDKLLFSEDRFSFLSDDYRDLTSQLQGVSLSNGLEFQLYLFQGSDDVYGVVTYVALNSDASTKNIKRGDFFIGVDGQRLNRDNFGDLLFGSNTNYTLTMATLSDNSISENEEFVELTKVENFAESPILVSTVIEDSGKKIGYLMYNSFVATYDDELNDVFGEFKAANVDELVLDFRYNGGGRVSSAVQIASSVYDTNTNNLFLKARYNDKIQSTFEPGDGETFFSSSTISGNPINSLNLERVFVITTESTASASELVINGLEPYLDVVQVGATTVGKNEFSNTFVDDIGNSYFYNPDREDQINPDNQWAIQPLLGRNENADGFSDYTAGLNPDFELEEDIANLGILGDPSEPLLALAIGRITGGASAKLSIQPSLTADVFYRSLELKRTNKMALMDGLLKMDLPIKR